MTDIKFDPKQLDKLNNPERLITQSPDLIWKTLNLTDPKILIDIGAGTGFFAVPFAGKAKQAVIYACDTSDVMLEWMRKNLPEQYGKQIIPIKSEESSIPLEANKADLAYMINLHHELEAPQDMLNEAMRLIRSGGSVMVIDWKTVESPSGPPLEIRIPIETIKQQFKEAGLQNIRNYEVLPYHCFVVGEKP